MTPALLPDKLKIDPSTSSGQAHIWRWVIFSNLHPVREFIKRIKFRVRNPTPSRGVFSNGVKLFYKAIRFQVEIILKKIRNRTPEKLKDFGQRFILPYLSIVLVVGFVLISNFIQGVESSREFLPNEKVMDLSPGEVAKTVNILSPYTSNIEEDSVHVALAMKDTDYLGKPLIAETAETKIDETRKSTITYTVEGGDTLSSIGWKYGLKISTIKGANGLTSDNIRPGQKLKLPPQDLSSSALAKLSAATTKTAFKGTFGKPVSGWDLSQGFGHTSFERWHTGVDFTSRSGKTIFASASGQVVATNRGWGGGYGNHLIISHGNGFTTLYGHLSQINVSKGQWVNQGQVIGIMGSTGWSTGVHLHFEIRKNNVPQNPLNYL